MKPLPTVRFLLLALSIGVFSCSSSKYAQNGNSEYDDLYFNKGDRYPIMTEGTTTVVQGSTDEGVGIGYNSKTLNPDYGLPQDAQLETDYSGDEYYVENHDDAYMEQAVEDYLRNNSTTARRYNSPGYGSNFDDVFWSDPLYYQGTIFDPLYRSYYDVYSPFAYRPYYRPYSSFYRPWGPRLSVNLAFGFGYGSRYYDPFYYGGGFGYGYGYGSPYSRYYSSSAWCPPSYYGGSNNTVVINNIENDNPGNVRYGTRQSRGNSSYIVNNGIRERSTANATSNTASRSIRSRADNTVRRATERTISNDRVVQQDRSRDMRTRSVDQYDQSERTSSRFRTHSLDSRTNNNYGVNERRSSSSVQQRGRSINKDTYRTPNRNIGTRRSVDRNRSYSTSPSRTSGSRISNTPSRSAASSGVRSRSNNSRRSSAPSRVGSNNYGRSSSAGRVSSPSRTSSPSRSFSSPSRTSSPSRVGRTSSPSPSRSSSPPSRGSSGSSRSVTR